MTISTESTRVEYTGDGATLPFAVPFKFLVKTDLVVVLRTILTGVDAVQTLYTHYTVTGAGDASGTVTFVTAPPSTQRVVIYNDPPLTQLVDYLAGDTFPAETHETALDRLTIQQKRTREITTRAILLPDADTDGSGAYDAKSNRIKNLGTPIATTDAATKTYTDVLVNNTALGPAPTGLIATGSVTSRLLADRFADLINPKDFGAVGDGVTDDTVALQAFFDSLEANDYGTASADGEFLVSSGVTLTSSLTKKIVGNCRITANAAIENVFTLTDFDWGHWEKLDIRGTGGPANYAGITCDTGLYLIGSALAKFEDLYVRNFRFAGCVVYGGNSNMVSLGYVTAIDCGSGCTYHALASVTGAWSNPVNSGTSGSGLQRTTIDVTNLPPDFILDNTYGVVGLTSYMVRIEGYPYYIESIDQANSKMSIFPWLPSTATPGSFEYVFGGGIFLKGADQNVVGIDMLDATRCGIGLCVNSLYGANARRFVSQGCGAAIVIGNSPAGACLGGHYDGIYFELNAEDIIITQPNGTAGYNYFGSEYALNLAKCFTLSAPRLSSGELHPVFTAVSRNPMRHEGRIKEHLWGKYGENFTNSFVYLSPHERSADLVYYNQFSKSVTLQSLDNDKNRLFGEDCAKITFIGGGASNEPPGTITFNPPAGWTVNGGASSVYTGFTSPVTFAAFWDISATNVVVAAIAGEFSGTVTFTAADATPTVAIGRTFITAGSTAITDFDDGVDGQIITVRAHGAITLTDSANLQLQGNADFVMALDDIVTLANIGGTNWYETGRRTVA